MSDQKYQNLVQYALGIFTFISVTIPSLTSVSILVLLLSIILAYVKKAITFKLNKVAMLFVAFYGAYLIGSFYTDNPAIASKYLEYKLSLLIFPFLLSFQQKNKPFSIQWASIGLILGVFVVIILGIGNAFICQSNGGVSCFYTVSISPIHHPSYFMGYIILAISTAWYGWMNKWDFFKLWWIVPFSLIGIVFHTYALSFAGLLFLMMFVGGVTLYFIYKKWGKIPAVILIVLFPVIAYTAVKTIPSIRGEYEGSVRYVSRFLDDPIQFIKERDVKMTGSEQRLVMWLVSFEEIKEKPFGVGTGDVDDVLGNRLIALGQSDLASKKLNPHNQYLQTTVEIGVIGLLILLVIIFSGIFIAFKNRNWLLLILVTNLAFNSLFESMLQRQSGIVFYVFWFCLLLMISKNTNSLETKG